MSEETVEETSTETADAAPETAPSTGKDPVLAELRRKVKDAEKRATAAEAKVEAEQRAKDESDGKFKEIAEKAEAEKAELEAKIADGERRQLATTVATRLKFRNPTLAHKLVDPDDLTDEATAERAFKALAKSDSYLIDAGPERTGTQVGGDTQTKDDPALATGQNILAAVQARG